MGRCYLYRIINNRVVYSKLVCCLPKIGHGHKQETLLPQMPCLYHQMKIENSGIEVS